jgi:hypothetical protein
LNPPRVILSFWRTIRNRRGGHRIRIASFVGAYYPDTTDRAVAIDRDALSMKIWTFLRHD